MGRALVALVIELCFAGSVARAHAGGLAPGCLPEGAKKLRPVAIRFNGLEPAKDVARFYGRLWNRSALPCRKVTLDGKQTLSEVLMAPEYRTTPGPYVAEMDALICQLNPRSCANGRLTARTLVVPDVRLKSHFPIWKSIPLDPGDAPDKDLEGVLVRHHVSLPEQADSQPEKIDRAAWLETIRKANIGFTRQLTETVSTEGGGRAKRPQLLVPVREYRATIELPAKIANMPGKKFGISDFTFDPDAPLAPSVHTNGTPVPAGPTSRFADVLRQISMPVKLPEAEGAPASILLADRGIDPECIFLHPDRDVPPDVLAAVGAGNSPCATAKHGTHVWGIIAGLVPNVMRGVAVIDRVAPDVETWDFDTHGPGEDFTFSDFVSGSVGRARVANFSFDFGQELTPAQQGSIVKLVKRTRSILYVVAADNQPTAYDHRDPLTLPVSLNGQENVIVVTALDEAGTGVWSKAARNSSETEDVVLVAAPGIGISSPCGDTRVGNLDGTSQATAFVSGAAALLVRDGLDDSLYIKRRLAYSADVLPDLLGGVAGGRLNIERALGSRHDKLCDFTDRGDGVACAPWTQGISMLGYESSTGFKPAQSVVLKDSSSDTWEVRGAATNLLRIARLPVRNDSSSADGFAVFYLERDESGPSRLRRRRVMTIEAFSDAVHHGPLVIQLEHAGTKKTFDLEDLGDFMRRVV